MWIRRPVPGFPGYYVGNDGSMWSMWKLRHRPGKGRTGNEVYLSETLRQLKTKNSRGYRRVMLYKEGKPHEFGVHRLVLLVFVGACPEGKECCHKDGNPSNNHVSNLYWGTKSENTQDQIRHGTFQKIIEGSRKFHTGRKVTDEVKARISAAHKGKPKTQEHRDKVRANHWSKRPDAAEIAARAAAKNRGKKHSDEHKAKIAEGNRRRWAKWRKEQTETDDGSV